MSVRHFAAIAELWWRADQDQSPTTQFFADATGLPQQALQDGLETHLMQLKGQIDAYAAGDYEQAYELAREAYAHMYELGTTLAGAIVAQSPDTFSR